MPAIELKAATMKSATIMSEVRRFARFLLSEMKPKGKILTPFNVISGAIILLSAVLLIIRFTKGLGSVTNLTQEFPWGIWKGFNVVTGVAFAGGAYVVTFLVYVLRQDQYHSIVRVTVLNGLLAYMFYAGALLLELGRPWNIINPVIGNSFGVSSVLFLIAWHFMLYMIAQFIEFSPTISEWLGWKRARKILHRLTLGAVIFGISLSMLHQSGLGALFLMAKSKIHPLWYSEFIPILFFVSSIFAGLSMVIFEGSISQKIFRSRLSLEHQTSQPAILLGLGKICAGTMYVYLFLKVLVFIHGHHAEHLFTPMGLWYLVEVIGFVAIPCVLFTIAVRRRLFPMIRIASILTLLGIVLNRLNVSIIAYNWNAAVRYVPSWMEVVVAISVILTQIWVFRWVINRMPVLNDPPAWVNETEHARQEYAPAVQEPLTTEATGTTDDGGLTVPIDIFATKGTEYLLIIFFLVSLMAFWRLLNTPARSVITSQVAPATPTAAAAPTRAPGRWFSMAGQRYYHPGHSWLLPESDDIVTIGIDDFAQQLIGEAGTLHLPEPGTRLQQGEQGWSLGVGKEKIAFLSPVEGEVIARNEQALSDPALVNRDPYGEGWLLQVRTPKLKPISWACSSDSWLTGGWR